MSFLQHVPTFSLKEAAHFARDLYGIEGRFVLLPSERDQNFLLTTASGAGFVLKIANSQESRDLLEAQNLVLDFLENKRLFCPRIIRTRSGELIEQVTANNASHYVRLVTYIQGEPLAKVRHSPQLLFDLGRKLGLLAQALSEFDHPALHRAFHWDLANGLEVIRDYSSLIAESDLRAYLSSWSASFADLVSPQLPRLPLSTIHGDANDYNVLAKDDQVTGLIDFGDMVHSYTVGDLAVAIAYVVLEKEKPVDAASKVVAGYLSNSSLSVAELNVLWPLIVMRLCMSLCLAAYQLKQRPDNEYLNITQRPLKQSLPALFSIADSDVSDRFQEINDRTRTAL